MKGIIVAIDGYSSTGKSTLAKALAKKLAYAYIDTGAMYRAVTLYALRKGYVKIDSIDEVSLENSLNDIEITFVVSEGSNSEVCLNGEHVEGEIRGMEVSKKVSYISAIPAVRELLVAQQQQMGISKCIVMDGRDIGSVVFPDAELKLFMTASEGVRAQRRYSELTSLGEQVSLEEVRRNISERDYRDTHREIAPLVQVADAIVLDNSNLTPDQQLEWVLERVRNITA